MGLLQPESLLWADQIEGLKGKTRKEWRAELKKIHDLSTSQITNLLAVKACFDQAAIDKVRQAEKSNPSFTLSLNSAMALSGLKNKVDDLSVALNAALDMTLAQRLATKKIKNLVEWVISGKPASEFDPKAKTAKKGAKKGKTEEEKGEESAQPGITNLDLKKLRQLLEKAEAERIQGNETTAQGNLEAYLRKIFGSSPSKKGKKTSAAEDGLFEMIFRDWLADIPVITQIKSKVKKKKPITGGEEALLGLHKIGGFMGRGVKGFFKLFKPLFKIAHWAWKMIVEALKELGLYKYAKAIFTLVVVAIAIWFAWETFRYGVMRPMEMIWSKIHHGQTVASSANGNDNEPLAQPSLSSQLAASAKAPSPLEEPKPIIRHKAPPHVMAYVPSVSFKTTDFDPKLLEQEIAAIPANSVIKDYVFQPDEGMPADLAVSRLQDLTDADKYTMMIGSGKQKILSVNATTTNFIVNYKSSDVFGVFGDGSGQLNFFWEDVKYIHANEIDVETKTPSVIYQCSLVVSDTKNPLTIQCATPEDLEHLVSTIEYFIRTSRLGHDTTLAGMPYSLQGLRLTNDGVVDKLWADSPADKAGLQLGDHLWSIGEATGDPQEKKDFEKGLSSLPVTVFVASDSDWNKASIAKNSGMTTTFRPKLRQVSLGQ